MVERTNNELIKEIINGSEEAFNDLYEKYYRMVYYVALKTMRNDADAQDVVQDVFMQIKNSIDTVKNPQYLQLWISRITVNKCNMLYRKRKEVLLNVEENDKEFLVSDEAYLPQDHYRFQNDQELLMYFIDQLPASQRLMIVLMYYEQLSVDEIAKVCGIPSGTVKSRLKTARDTLKRKIELYEKQEDVKLDFRMETLPSLIAFALTNEAIQLELRQAKIKKKVWRDRSQGIYQKAIAASSLLVTTLLGGGVILMKQFDQAKHDEGNANSLVETETSMITPEDAYYEIMMWANTPTLVEIKKDDIFQYHKYYEVLKREHGVYWSLFLQSDIQKYFE